MNDTNTMTRELLLGLKAAAVKAYNDSRKRVDDVVEEGGYAAAHRELAWGGEQLFSGAAMALATEVLLEVEEHLLPKLAEQYEGLELEQRVCARVHEVAKDRLGQAAREQRSHGGAWSHNWTDLMLTRAYAELERDLESRLWSIENRMQREAQEKQKSA